MVECSHCLNNLSNSNVDGIRRALEQWMEEQDLDTAGTIELLQNRICESCTVSSSSGGTY